MSFEFRQEVRERLNNIELTLNALVEALSGDSPVEEEVEEIKKEVKKDGKTRRITKRDVEE